MTKVRSDGPKKHQPEDGRKTNKSYTEIQNESYEYE